MSTLNATSTTADGTESNSPHTGDLRLLLHQIRYEWLSFWRNPQSMIFTFAFPVVLFTIFGAVFGSSDERDSFFFGVSGLQYYTPTIAALSVLGACYAQLAIILSMRRQTGVLKRLHATPLPSWVYFGGLVAHCVVVSVIVVGLIIGVASLYGVPLPGHWLAIVVTLVLGAASFCALGVGVSSVISNSEAAPAVVQFIQLPLVFISGSYIPIHSEVLNNIARYLPVKPFNNALLAPFAQNGGFQWRDLAILLAWGVIGAFVAVRRFRWDPRPE